MSRSSSERSITITGRGDVLAGAYEELDDYTVQDDGVLARVAANHIFRHEYDAGEVEFRDETLRVRIPHEFDEGALVHDYVVEEDGAVYQRHSLPTAVNDFTREAADAKHHHLIESEFKRLVARSNKVVQFADEIIGIYDRNPQVAEDIMKEYRWGPVLEPAMLARNVSDLHRHEGGPTVLPAAMRDVGFGATDHVSPEDYAAAYEELLDRAAAGERTGSLDFEEGTKGRSLADFYEDGVKGDEMREMYPVLFNQVIRKVNKETGIGLDKL